MNFKVPMFAVIIMATVIISNGGEFTGDKVLRVFPATDLQVKLLINLEETEPLKYDFWKFPGGIGKAADIHVKALDYNNFASYLNSTNMKYEILAQDLQTLMDHQNDYPLHTNDSSIDWYSEFHPFDEIVKKLTNIVDNNNGQASAEIFSIGKTIEERNQWAVKIQGSPVLNKPVMFINCGIHAREWVGPATCMYMIEQLITKYGKDPAVTTTLDKLDFIILPVLNADGYVYSWTPWKRLWRKNRRPPLDPSSGCYGVDLNRNFHYKWGEQVLGASSRTDCSGIYNGKSAESEPEVQNVANYLRHLKESGTLMAYFDIHSYSQLWMLPWGYTKDPPLDYAEMLRVANIGKVAIEKHSGTEFGVGSSSNLLYATTGTTKDFVYGELNVPYTYVLELRDKGKFGFILPTRLILPAAQETFIGIQAMTKEMNLNYIANRATTSKQDVSVTIIEESTL